MRLSAILYSQGFGTRRECVGRVLDGHVSIAGQICDDPDEDLNPAGLVFSVDGRDWPYREKALVVLHKPANYECSMKPRHHPSVMSLLPAPLRTRGLQPVGRLDEDTTGLLLLTDDGALIHRLTSPKKHMPKVYEVTARHPIDERQLKALRTGVVLDDDPAPVAALEVQATGEHTLRMTLTEGRYHQVKRMVAAVGNRVDALHRSAIGRFTLPADLAPGQWRWLEPAALYPAPAGAVGPDTASMAGAAPESGLSQPSR
ncbi:MAG: 16S rRNA pseudouridine(516) synthase [Betaproteobacteria bacterium]